MTAPGAKNFSAGRGHQRSLQQYLPRLVRSWDDEAPGVNHRSIEGSMVFVDISGFTKMSERLARHGKVGAEEVAEVIGDTFGRLLTNAYSYGAGLLKFGGDALLLWFSDEGHTVRACASAYSMRQTLRDIGVFRTTAGNVSLRMSIGIHSGNFDFFMLGGLHRELFVAGPAATSTVQMESAATAGQILISPQTAESLPPSLRGKPLGPGLLLKGAPDSPEQQEVITGTVEADLVAFIPTALRDTLLAGDLDPGHRPATVAFLQFTGFDGLIEARGADEACNELNRVVRLVQEVVADREVTFLSTDVAADGGKMILTSGVPTATGHDEEQLLLALTSIFATPSVIPIKAGVNWGHVFAGEIGPPYRRTYTVMGDTVNLAARLMARAESGQILATGEALDGSRTVFATTALEPFLVKGKRRPVQAFAVGAAEGTRAAATTTATPLLGRDREMKEMLGAATRAINGAGTAIEIEAGPGMGKSRLLEEFLSVVGSTRVIKSECRLYQSATPYFPFQALLRSALELDAECSASDLERLVASRAPDLLPWLSLLAAPLNMEIEESPEVASLEDEFRRARINQSVRRILEASVTQPTVFVIEDTHWMDEASGDLLTALLDGWNARPWLMVVSRRPVTTGYSMPEDAKAIHLKLKPLARADAEALIIAATESSPLRPQQVTTLAERAEGSPLFLIELLQALRQGEDVDELPHSVEGLIGARIDKLPPVDRNILRRMAVLGAGFRAEHAPVVLPETPGRERAGSSIPATVRRMSEFLTMDQTGWIRFRHALIRDAAYAGLPFRTRQALHAQVGDSIKAEAGDHPELQAGLLSLHYSQAGRWSEAWTFSRVAGHGAKQVYANLEAATFYRRALTAARHVTTSPEEVSATAEALGDVLQLAGLYDEARQAYRHATLRAQEPARQADLFLKQATTRAFQGSYSTAIRDISTGRRLLGNIDSVEARRSGARLTAQLAWLKQIQQRPREALQIARRAIEEAEAVGEKAALAKAYTVADTSSILLGQSSEAKYAAQALAIFEELGDLPSTAAIMNNLGGQSYFEGDWNGALEHYAKAQEAYRKAGDEPSSAMVGSNIGELLVSQRRYNDAETVLVEAVRVLRSHHLADAVFAESQLARLRLNKGEVDQAIAMLKRLRDEAIAVKEHQSQVEAALYLCQGYLKLGEPETALATLEDAERVAGDDAELFGCAIARIRGQALVALGRPDEARRVWNQGIALARDQQMLFEEAQLLLLAASLEEDAPQSQELAEKAGGLLRQLGVVQSVGSI